MADNRRLSGTQVWGGAAGYLTWPLLVLILGGCRVPESDTLSIVERIPLPGTSLTSLYLDATGSMWLGRAGEILRVDTLGREISRISVPEAAIPEVAGTFGDFLYFRTPASVLVVHAGSDRVVVERLEMGFDDLAVDVRGRFVARASEAGAVLAYDPATLEPIWGWAAVGATSSAVALSPEGDRIFQAVGGDGDQRAELLVRDVQTGRILLREALSEPAHAMLAAPRGDLLLLSAGPAGGAITALRLRQGEFRPLWRRSLAELRLEAPVRIRLAPDGRRLLAVSLRNEGGLHILEVETGRTLDRLRAAAIDATFGQAGEIYLLYPGEVTRVE